MKWGWGEGGSRVASALELRDTERELLTCELTLDTVLEVVLVLSLVLCGAHRVPGKHSKKGGSVPVRQVVMWGGRSWLEALPHIQCEVTMCDSAVICAPTAAGLLGRCAAFRDGAETVHSSGGA